MAGGKETSRQKMIGMMYLVLTALLALNVSKEVIAAFVSINDKINESSRIIDTKSTDIYQMFDQKRAALLATGSKTHELDNWHQKALVVKSMTNNLVNYILSESNEMIKEAEGIDWIASKKEDGNIQALKPLINIKNMDNYDIPTRFFVGSNPSIPEERGLLLQSKIHAFRDSLCELMGNTTYGGKTYTFTSPKDVDGLENALNSVLPEDKVKIKQIYKALSIPDELESYTYDKDFLPWASVMFDHAPIVAAATLLNALKLDIKNSESEAADFFLNKTNVPIFVFNKIQPLPFAARNYINSGDSLDVNIMIAAYDSTAEYGIRYGIDEDTLEEKWKETYESITVAGSVGNHRIKGAIGVKQRGEIKWKPWSFNYTVGAPMGVIAQPEMRILYEGYNNIIEGTASGFPSESIRLTGNGCTLNNIGGQRYNVRAARGRRTASINISAIKEDGTRVNLGTYNYDIKPLPTAVSYLGSIKNGDTPSHSEVISQRRVSLRFGPEVILDQVPLDIIKGAVEVQGINRKGKIKRGGFLDNDALAILRQSRGKLVTVQIKYRDPGGRTKNAQSIVFKSR